MYVIIVPLVGMRFRKPAEKVLATLASGWPLLLEPEPDNPYDAKAIKVSVEVSGLDETSGLVEDFADCGLDFVEMVEAGDAFHLGYLADSDGKVCQKTGGPGNREVGEMMAASDTLTTLQFDERGMAEVRVEGEQKKP